MGCSLDREHQHDHGQERDQTLHVILRGWQTAERTGPEQRCPYIIKCHLLKAIDRGEGSLDWAVMAREQARASGLEK